MIYNDIYAIIDSNMSNSNIGARKNRNIRDHLFVIHAIVNDIINNKDSDDVDFQIYDIAKCFDKLEFTNTATDFYIAGGSDDRFITVTNSNKNCDIAIKTPWGKTPRFTLNNIEMQGTVLAGLKCSVSIDTIGKEALQKEHNILYKYRNCTSIPPLSLIDDIIGIAKCSPSSVELCGTIKAKISGKQLELSERKCHHMHIGKVNDNCPVLTLNEKEMQKSKSERYLGDIISANGRNDENIEDRYNKGIGYVTQIVGILKEISFGQFFFEQALQLRNAKLVNGLLCSIEAMYGLTNSNIETLEKCDRFLFRKIFNCPVSTPIESFYLETGTMPIRFIIIGRRLLFYWSILNKSENELAKQVLLTQQISPVKNDWCSTVEEDLRSLNIDMHQDTIAAMKKTTFKKLVQSKLRETAFAYLLELKRKHSKSANLTASPQIQKYLSSCDLTTQEKQVLFSLRTRTFDCKANYKNGNDTLACNQCGNLDEQEHLIQCAKDQSDIDLPDVKYSDIFGTIQQQVKVAKAMKKILDFRKSSSTGSQEHRH